MKATMKKIHFALVGLAMSAATLSAQTLATPEIGDYSDFTGSAFVAHWGSVEGAQSYLLNVYREDVINLLEETADFSKSTLPECVTSNGNYLSELKGWALEKDGDYVELTLADGQFRKLVLAALQYDNEGVTADNTSNFLIELYNAGGERIIYGEGNSNYFATNYDLDIFEAFSQVVPEISSVRISLHAEGSRNVGKLLVQGMDYAQYAPVYVKKNERVTGTSYALDGLDAEETYFYNVSAVKGAASSHKSADKCVDGFLKPVTLKPLEVTESSYTANWEHTPKAWEYIVSNYRVDQLEAGEDVSVFADYFKDTYVGSVEVPYSVDGLDGYADHLGWIGNKLAIAEGMIGTTQGSKTQGYRGYNYLKTPVLDLSASKGVYTISLKAYTNAKAETLNIYNTENIIVDESGKQSLNIHAVNIPASGYVEATWTMDDGMKDMRIAIEPAGLNSFFIDDFVITQQIEESTTRYTLVDENRCDAECYDTTFEDLEWEGQYAYTVKAFRFDYYGYENYSEVSDYQYVKLGEPDGVTFPVAKTSATPCYDLSGRRVTSLDGLRFYIQNGRKVVK